MICIFSCFVVYDFVLIGWFMDSVFILIVLCFVHDKFNLLMKQYISQTEVDSSHEDDQRVFGGVDEDADVNDDDCRKSDEVGEDDEVILSVSEDIIRNR